jgi:D-xylose transport system permease protein
MTSARSTQNGPAPAGQGNVGSQAEPRGWRASLAGSLRTNARQYAMVVALAVIWLVFAALTGGVFLTPRNLSNLVVQTVTTGLLAVGVVLVIVAGHIDLSVGSVLGFTGAVCATLMIGHGWGVAPAVAATLAVGLAIGAWHGFWVAYRRVPAFIVTLASMLAFRGLIIGITGGQTQGLEMAPEQVAARFQVIGQGYLPTLRPAVEGGLHDTSLVVSLAVLALLVVVRLRAWAARRREGLPVSPAWAEVLRTGLLVAVAGAFAAVLVFYQGIPWSVFLLLGLAALLTFVANDTTFGRRLYAIGGNPEAARLSGIHVPRTTLALFMVMGAMSAVAGIVCTSRLNAATTSAGQNGELDAIAAAVIGGASLMGGEGTVPGALIGALVMASLDNGMSLMNMDITWQYVIKGLILLLAVWVDMAQRRAGR